MPGPPSGSAAAWVAHLRDGGTLAWERWRATESGDAVTGTRLLPGAQQLELLRRINLAAAPGRGPSVALAERVLTASAPGRGRPDLELVGVAPERPRFGPAPVDPAELPEEELIRVAAGVVADEVVAAGLPGVRPARRPRPWRRDYRLVGDPWLVAWARPELTRLGHPPGGPGSPVAIVGRDLGSMLVDAWCHRLLTAGPMRWEAWLDGLAGSRPFPPRVDLPALARRWAGRAGPARVRVVTAPQRLAGAVGVRRPLGAPPVLSAEAAELVRLVFGPMGLLVAPERRTALLRGTLVPRLSGVPGDPVGVPPAFGRWVARRSRAMRRDLAAAGYPVAGDLDEIVYDPWAAAQRPVGQATEAGVLALAIRLLLEHDRGSQGQEDRT